MGHFRFRRRLKLFPGLHLNISKRGYSISVGESGLTTNISKKGVRETVGLPGTGISYQTRRVGVSHPQRRAEAPRQSVSPMSVLAFVLVLAAVLWILGHLH
jgi:hypothetical protein